MTAINSNKREQRDSFGLLCCVNLVSRTNDSKGQVKKIEQILAEQEVVPNHQYSVIYNKSIAGTNRHKSTAKHVDCNWRLSKPKSTWNQEEWRQNCSKSTLSICSKKWSKSTSTMFSSPNTIMGKSNWDMLFESEIEQSFGKSETKTTFEGSDWNVEESDDSSIMFESASEDMVLSFRNGEVLLTLITKVMTKFRYFPMDKRLQQVTEWLNEGFARNIPIHGHHHLKGPKSMNKFRERSIADIFGDRLNIRKNGIVFFVGPVEGKICFNMMLSDLKMIKSAIREVDL